MTPRSSSELLAKLRERVNLNLAAGERLRALPDEQLNRRAAPKSWSALEAIEHLNRYGDFYHPAFATAIDGASGPVGETFTSSWLGNKFAAGMKPGPKTRKVKTFPSKNPLGSQLDRGVLDTFVEQQRQLLALLDRAATVDLTRTRVPTTLSRFVNLRLGDGLRTIIYHDWRHTEQALRAAG